METRLTCGLRERSRHVRSPRYPIKNWGRTRKSETLIRVVYNKTQGLDLVCIHKDLYQSMWYIWYLNNSKSYKYILLHLLIGISHQAIDTKIKMRLTVGTNPSDVILGIKYTHWSYCTWRVHSFTPSLYNEHRDTTAGCSVSKWMV